MQVSFGSIDERSGISPILALRDSEFHFCSARLNTIFRACVPSDADTTIGTAMPLESLRPWGDSRLPGFCSKQWQNFSMDVKFAVGRGRVAKFFWRTVRCIDSGLPRSGSAARKEILRVDPLLDAKRFAHE
jgi:hypothetical protein